MFINKTPAAESHPTAIEMRDLPWSQVDPNGKHDLFLHEQLGHLHTEYTQTKLQSNIAFDEDIMENYYMFVMLWNLSVISHLIFPQCFFLFLGAKSKNNLRGYVAF